MEPRKITVKHYLNLRAKPQFHGKEKFYPLYIQIIVTGKKAQIKSRINEHLKIYRSDIERITHNDLELKNLFLEGYFSETWLKLMQKQKLFPLWHLLNDEINVITRIIKYHDPFHNKDFSLSNFSVEYQKHSTEITHLLDESIKEWYRDELKNLFLKAIDQDENKELFRLTNYFIHFINWNNSFSSFYETTFEILPSELKMLENMLSNELRVSIKAYLAFHTKVNILKRFFEKRELGRISILSYLDWETDIREFLRSEFEKIFGEQKALEYIISLDDILTKKIKQ